MRIGASAFLALLLWALPGSGGAQVSPDSLAALVAAGDRAWDAERHPAARAAYAAALAVDSAYSTRAVFRLGLLESWRSRFPDALALLRLYVRLEPRDLDGRVALARTNAWANRFGPALAHYDTVLASDASYRPAILGRATTLAWADRIPEAERALTAWLMRTPDDAEAWALLGQFRRWRGASRQAETALQRALAVDSTHALAREQLAWVHADLHPAATATLVWAEDSEDNQLRHVELGATATVAPGLRATGHARLRSVDVASTDALVIPGALGILQWQPEAAPWMLRAELGVVQYPDGIAPGGAQGRAGLRASTRAGRWRFGTGIGREPLDEVRSMAGRALMFTVGNVDASYAVNTRVSLGLAASRGDVSGAGVANSRSTGLAAARYTPRRGTSLAVRHRIVRWDAPAFGVFFAPQQWTVTEASVGWERPVDLGWILGGDVAVGAQAVGFRSDPVSRSTAPRAVARLGYRAKPGREILASFVYANVAGVGTITASDYRYGALTIGGRWTF